MAAGRKIGEKGLQSIFGAAADSGELACARVPEAGGEFSRDTARPKDAPTQGLVHFGIQSLKAARTQRERPAQRF